MIELYILSFVAGVLTAAAPCILPLLPIVIGGSALSSSANEKKDSLKHPLIIVASLIVSIILFTLLLKATSLLLGVPTMVWMLIAGGVIILFGINLLFPALWEKVMIATGLAAWANRFMGNSGQKNGIKRDILLGISLGPVFNSCSPTYALIVAAILPASFLAGLGYLFTYAIGLGFILLLISIFGRALVNKMKWLANPNGLAQKVIGGVFILVGLAVIFGWDKDIQTFVLEQGWYDWVIQIEKSFEQK